MRWHLVDYYGTQPLEGKVPYLQDLLVHETTVHQLLRYSTWKEARSQEELYFRKEGSQGRDTISTSTQDDFSNKVLTKRTQQLIGKSHIYMAKRRYSTSYWSINFTIWSATGSASSTYLMNWSWSHVGHMPLPRMPIFAKASMTWQDQELALHNS